VKYINQIEEFSRLVKPIMSWSFREIDEIRPDIGCGFFSTGRKDRLIEFCRKNTQFHIISHKHGKIYNDCLDDADAYSIAEGNADPALVFRTPLPSAIDVWDYEEERDELYRRNQG